MDPPASAHILVLMPQSTVKRWGIRTFRFKRLAIGFGAMDVTRPNGFMSFGAMDVTKPYGFIGLGAMDVTKPYKFIGFGAWKIPHPRSGMVFRIFVLGV